MDRATTCPSLPLNDGRALPAIGLGLWKVDPDRAPDLIRAAVQCGYRHFDSASDYGNESQVGEGLQRVLTERVATREQLWVTSKLWNTNHAAKHVRPAAERSLRDLRLQYLDLYLIHFPIALQYVPPDRRYPAGWFFDPDAPDPRMVAAAVPIQETWQAMESLVRDRLVRTIGVSNFNCALLRDLLSYAEIRPAVLQVEMHPYLTQEKLIRFCEEEQIAVTAFSPLGAPSYVPLQMAEASESVLDHPMIRQLAEQYRKTPAQIVLRWGYQRGTAVVPKTNRTERLRENLDIFDFELSADELAAISGLNQNRRFNDPGVFCEKAFHTFFPIFD